MDLFTNCSRWMIDTKLLLKLLPAPGEFKRCRFKNTITDFSRFHSLFHVVVDNDETASAILAVLIKERLGRITFIPLNRLKSQTIEYPNAKEAIAM